MIGLPLRDWLCAKAEETDSVVIFEFIYVVCYVIRAWKYQFSHLRTFKMVSRILRHLKHLIRAQLD